jgi:hypothetical protein
MNNHYKNATLTHIYDKARAGETFNNIEIQPIELIKDNLEVFCIITAVTPSIRREMVEILLKYNKPEDTFVCASNTDFGDA